MLMEVVRQDLSSNNLMKRGKVAEEKLGGGIGELAI
jgi:hypothetical protein